MKKKNVAAASCNSIYNNKEKKNQKNLKMQPMHSKTMHFTRHFSFLYWIVLSTLSVSEYKVWYICMMRYTYRTYKYRAEKKGRKMLRFQKSSYFNISAWKQRTKQSIDMCFVTRIWQNKYRKKKKLPPTSSFNFENFHRDDGHEQSMKIQNYWLEMNEQTKTHFQRPCTNKNVKKGGA